MSYDLGGLFTWDLSVSIVFQGFDSYRDDEEVRGETGPAITSDVWSGSRK